jgi:hypothetical protein
MGGIVIAGLLGCGATFFITMVVLSFLEGVKSKSLHSIEGEILSSDVAEWVTQGGWFGDNYITGGETCYTTKIVYRYVVNGTEYYSERVDAREKTGGNEGRKNSSKLVTKYFRGKKVTVYYDPRNPHKALLEQGIKLNGVMLIEAFMGFILIPCLIVITRFVSDYRNDIFLLSVGIGIALGFTSAFILNRAINKNN